MNREIKFRAWDESRGIHYPDSIQNPYPEYSVKLMQFTGLKDKNGKEIYEGDLMKYLVHYPQDYQKQHPKKKFGRVAGPVQWTKGWLYLDYDGENNGDNTLLYEEEAKNWEIIGNIYENPDLLALQSKGDGI